MKTVKYTKYTVQTGTGSRGETYGDCIPEVWCAASPKAALEAAMRIVEETNPEWVELAAHHEVMSRGDITHSDILGEVSVTTETSLGRTRVAITAQPRFRAAALWDVFPHVSVIDGSLQLEETVAERHVDGLPQVLLQRMERVYKALLCWEINRPKGRAEELRPQSFVPSESSAEAEWHRVRGLKISGTIVPD